MVLTYGVLPTREQFDAAFDRECPEGSFRFGNDPRVGTCAMTSSELWREVCKAHADMCGVRILTEQDQELAGDWVSSVLGVLGIEWV